MMVNGHVDVILEEDDGIYEKGDSFKSIVVTFLPVKDRDTCLSSPRRMRDT